MKKLIVTLTMLLIITNLFSQTYGGIYDYFNQMPAYQKVLLYANDFSQMRNIEKYEMHAFKANDKTYMLSYDEYPNNITKSYVNGEKRERNLYLYCLYGDGWKIVSNKPLRTDYIKCEDNIILYNYYYPRLDKGGYVKKLDNGNIEIGLTIMNNTLTNQYKEYFHNEIITLQPIDGEKYQVIK